MTIVSVDFPAHTTEIDISNIDFTAALVLGGAVYGSFGTRPINAGNSYVTNTKIIYLSFINESWRDYNGSLILGYYK